LPFLGSKGGVGDKPLAGASADTREEDAILAVAVVLSVD
jgi:hypothetical protein